MGLKKRVKFHALRLPFFLRKISPQTGEWREKERGGIKFVTNSSIEGKITLFGYDIYKGRCCLKALDFLIKEKEEPCFKGLNQW